MLITNKLHLKIFINGHELHEVFLIYANDHQCSTYKYILLWSRTEKLIVRGKIQTYRACDIQKRIWKRIEPGWGPYC